MMKKLFSLLLALLFICTTIPAFSSEDPRVDEINAALDEVMRGTYAYAAGNRTAAEAMAPQLKVLSEITSKDLSVYAVDRKLDTVQVQNAYYTALANTLEAQLLLDPASASQYASVRSRIDQRSAAPSASGVPASQQSSSTSRNTNTPDRNTYNTPDRNTPDTPDRNTRNSPDRDT